ncbi:glycosyltransferase family 4 protein [Haloarcula sediminis]|uniref:glycosyltransferase family 4 protein n=1 Tax=Haloarcula sediminis TaxID=3111777 RepID=UPI002D77182A|nr:glycosyltransferase family 4 protein [Haloarcula sp. CK38]
MKVGIYLGSLEDNPRNIEKQLISWGGYLSEFELEVFGSAPLPDAAVEDYKHVKTTKRQPKNPAGKIAAAFLDTREYIQRRDPDVVVQIWCYLTHGPGVTLAAHHSNTASVVRFSGDHFAEFRAFNGFEAILAFALHNLVGRLPLRLADEVIALGPEGKVSVIDRGASESSVTVLPPAVSAENRFCPTNDRLSVRKGLNLPTDRRVALYVGRLSDRKGMGFLEEVITGVTEDDDVLFVVVGDGEYANVFRNQFSSDVVRLPGHIPYSDIHRYYQAADLYIHPSPYEGIPLVILEALKCEVPVLARDAGDIKYLTGSTVNTPCEMVDAIVNCQYEWRWEHREKFLDDYQSQTLKRVLKHAVTKD